MSITYYFTRQENGDYSVTAKYEKTFSVDIKKSDAMMHKDESRELAGKRLVEEIKRDICENGKSVCLTKSEAEDILRIVRNYTGGFSRKVIESKMTELIESML